MAHEQALTNRTAHETAVGIHKALEFKGMSLDVDNSHELKDRTVAHFTKLADKTPSASADVKNDRGLNM